MKEEEYKLLVSLIVKALPEMTPEHRGHLIAFILQDYVL